MNPVELKSSLILNLLNFKINLFSKFFSISWKIRQNCVHNSPNKCVPECWIQNKIGNRSVYLPTVIKIVKIKIYTCMAIKRNFDYFMQVLPLESIEKCIVLKIEILQYSIHLDWVVENNTVYPFGLALSIHDCTRLYNFVLLIVIN